MAESGMRWQKLGPIVDGELLSGWIGSHASVPTVVALDSHVARIFFSPRDEEGRSVCGWVDYDVSARVIVDLSRAPLLSAGRAGMFDDAGAMCCLVLNDDTQWRMYYVGWNRSCDVPFRNAVGLATSVSLDGPFDRVSQGPMIDRSFVDPCFVASPFVARTDDGWRMWYVSCSEWRDMSKGWQHRYDIKYAESQDGLEWTRTGRVCVPLRSEDEYAIARPWVLVDADGLHRMWYSYRGAAYRIGYAESTDGLEWERLDHLAGIGVSESGWDSEMIEYACVFDLAGQRYMAYNGNGYGATGIGLAVLDQD